MDQQLTTPNPAGIRAHFLAARDEVPGEVRTEMRILRIIHTAEPVRETPAQARAYTPQDSLDLLHKLVMG